MNNSYSHQTNYYPFPPIPNIQRHTNPSITYPQVSQNIHILPVPTTISIPFQVKHEKPVHQVKKPVRTFPIPEIKNNKAILTEMNPPKPCYFKDTETGEYGIRCVCGETHAEGYLIQCEFCEFWLHGICVNVARLSPNEPYLCPFCRGQKICCKCNKNNDYTEPLIQCSICKMWVHKRCEDIDYGIIPKPFICSFCGGDINTRTIPDVKFDDSYPDHIHTIPTDFDRHEFLSNIPEGSLKAELEHDLNRQEISFKTTITKYFHLFAPFLFNRPRQFWKVFIDSLSTLTGCDKQMILSGLEHLTMKLLYTDKEYEVSHIDSYHSESTTEFFENSTMTILDEEPQPAELYVGEDGHLHTKKPLDDGSFIIFLPGFLLHTDEVEADDGIPLSCFTITNIDIVIDLNGYNFPYIHNIRRSFHFNAIIKLVRLNGEAKAAIYATRMKGPLSEEKNRRGPAIYEDGEIILPFDGELPFEVKKLDWKDKKPKVSNNVNSNNPQNVNANNSNNVQNTQRIINKQKKKGRKQQKKKEKIQKNNFPEMEMSLLNTFDEAVPPLPFILLPDDDAVNRYRMQQEVKQRSRSAGGKYVYSD
ncbi:PHD-finger family protein [Histomonas meleagridis]|uniref:PHD-finger family protein n=1 Tax=Histomonas meleagridis TaxID=135588 RepID=UPI0035593814|nr:PHD-finger family protein [Histomonas meleagridis]KAH0806664.1 PHD-finger family protein [Histomonas meleagridis]